MAQDEIKLAGKALIDLADRDSDHGRHHLFSYEMELLEKSYEKGVGSEASRSPSSSP